MNSSNSPQTPETALPAIENAATLGARASYFRWIICALLFFATVIAYVDRGVIGYLEKYLETVIGWNTIQYGYITGAFQLAYAIGLVFAGRLTDRLGTRKGFAIAITIWSISAMLPGAAYSVLTFGVAMFILGLGEAANFPACIKTVAEWFPRKERALATGIFNSGANIGNIVVPLVVPFLVFSLGWRGAFIGTGALGFVWLGFWLRLYAKPEAHARVSIRRNGFRAYLGSNCFPGKKLGPSPSLNFSPTQSGGSISSGCPAICKERSTSISHRAESQLWRSTSCPSSGV
jgi:sugar phosphate permease